MKSKIITLSLMAVAAIASIAGRHVQIENRSASKLAGGGRMASYDFHSGPKLAGGGRMASYDFHSAKNA
jgi:hypothetical protein